jgi:hypothetical protein
MEKVDHVGQEPLQLRGQVGDATLVHGLEVLLHPGFGCVEVRALE